MKYERPQKIAVIGSGVAGLTAAYLLQEQHEVTIFESAGRLGGHTNTIVVPDGPDAGTPVDTGFIVMNHRNYPLFTRLLERLDVPLRDSNMSFGYYDLESRLQYCGSGLPGLFAQKANLFRPSFYRMLRDLLRFFKVAQQELNEHSLRVETLGEYLCRHDFSDEFIQHNLIPMGSAIWSTPSEQMMEFPAESFLSFFNNHGLLTINDRPQWRTVVNGSHAYIDKMQAAWKDRAAVRLNSRISAVQRKDNTILIRHADAEPETFDHVIIATHANQALPLLADPSAEESRLLGTWQYTRSRTYLHTDTRVMPPLKKVWSSWNFTRLHGETTCLTYDMNRLQGLRTQHHYFVSLNLPQPPEGILEEIDYEHPMYTKAALDTQPALRHLNGQRNTWFAGSYFGYGFHEDAVRSAVHVARAFGADL